METLHKRVMSIIFISSIPVQTYGSSTYKQNYYRIHALDNQNNYKSKTLR